MQDKITIADAPDCLNTNDKAMWVLGYQTAIEARSQCLHHIQEPATKTEALAHYSRQAILAMGEEAPAAVAVPDEREAFEAWWRINVAPGLHGIESDYRFWAIWQARAALAATPAAAPVVLPEPAVLASVKRTSTTSWDVGFNWPERTLRNEGKHKLFTEQQVRALLATATGLPAQADDIAELVTGMSVSVDVSTGDDDAGNRYFGKVTLAQEDYEGKHGLILLVQDVEPNFTPQAQADARDAERYRGVRLMMQFEKSGKTGKTVMTLNAPLDADATHDIHEDWMAAKFDASVDRTFDAAIAAAKGEQQ